MEYEEFMTRAIDEMRDRFPEAEISVQEVSKLQGQSYTGMSVRPENSAIGATLNLKEFYEAFDSGLPIEEVMNRIERSIDMAIRHMPNYDARMLADYDQIKDTLTIELVPVAGNEEKLSQIPHRNMADLAVVYRFKLESNAQGTASVLISNNMLAGYKITPDQLHADALEASMKSRPANLLNMSEAVHEMIGSIGDPLFTDEFPSLWVATAGDGQYGAGVIQYPGFLDQAAEMLGGNFYVLPSSVHEVLLVPDNGTMELDYLEGLVRTVNAEDVVPAERLSDNVYHYDSKEHIFENARTFEERQAAKDAAILRDEPFDKAANDAPAKDTIRVLLVEPNEHPKVVEIGTGLRPLQKAVGGDIEVVYPYADPVGLIVNEEGKINGLPLNRALRDEDNEIYDIVAGPFLVAGLTEDSFGSLTEEQISKFEALFHQPEAFVRMGHSILAIPIPDEALQARDADKAKEDHGEKPKRKAPDRGSL